MGEYGEECAVRVGISMMPMSSADSLVTTVPSCC